MSTFSRKKKDHRKRVERYHQRMRTEKNALRKQLEQLMAERNKQLELEKQQEANQNQ